MPGRGCSQLSRNCHYLMPTTRDIQTQPASRGPALQWILKCASRVPIPVCHAPVHSVMSPTSEWEAGFTLALIAVWLPVRCANHLPSTPLCPDVLLCSLMFCEQVHVGTMHRASRSSRLFLSTRNPLFLLMISEHTRCLRCV